MHITSLKLVNYKNYEQQQFRFSQSVVALVGDNGMGKTNVIDAIYYSCMGRSYFSHRDTYVMRKEAEFCRIESTFEDGASKWNVAVKMIPSKTKEIRTNGKKLKKLSDHIGTIPVVVIAPADISLLLEGSEDRRKFINNTIIQYDSVYLDHLVIYTKLLKQRNALLKQFIERRTFNEALLMSITERMYTPCAYIYEARVKFADLIKADFTENYGVISGENEMCDIKLSSQLHSHSIQELMIANLQKDRLLGRTTSGIHKDDLSMKMNGDSLKNFASQGQLKSYVLALKLAQYSILKKVSSTKPILMLDDIFDKLDTSRVSHLLKLVMGDDFGQVIITDANSNRVPDILADSGTSHDLYYINNGQARTSTHTIEEE